LEVTATNCKSFQRLAFQQLKYKKAIKCRSLFLAFIAVVSLVTALCAFAKPREIFESVALRHFQKAVGHKNRRELRRGAPQLSSVLYYLSTRCKTTSCSNPSARKDSTIPNRSGKPTM